VVVAVPDDDPGGVLEEFGEQVELMSIGRSHRQAGDEPWPAHPHVHPEAVEALLEERILAESRFSLEALAAVGTSEQTSRQGQRVADGEASIVGSKLKEFLPELFLELPERLADCLAKVVLCTSPRG
jgi:hypothetical protein